MKSNQIAKFIYKIRKDNNLTQQQLAEKLGVTYQAVSKWETGKNIPDIAILQQLSQIYNIDINELILGKKPKKQFSNKNIIILIFVLIITLFSLIYFKNKNQNYEFKNIFSVSEGFEVKGVIAFSNNKSSIYISEIIYNELHDDTKYKQVECVLYEVNGNSQTKISKCNSIDEKTSKCKEETLSNLLKTISFNVDNFSSTCKKFENNNLIIEINALDLNDKVINYKVPLTLKENC